MNVMNRDGLPAEMLNQRDDPLSLLRTRRSASTKSLGEPGPTPEQLDQILEVAVRVPDHGKLAPWRFILFEGDARVRMGEIMAERWPVARPDASADWIPVMRRLFLRAPSVLCVVSRAAPHEKIPEWEQVLSAGAVCQNILIAATALGLGCQWITEWCAYDPEIARAMGLGPQEKVAGFIYLGTPGEPVTDRPRPDPRSLLTRWQG